MRLRENRLGDLDSCDFPIERNPSPEQGRNGMSTTSEQMDGTIIGHTCQETHGILISMRKRPEKTEQTKADIKEAFWRLYAAKPIEKITVGEVCDLAGYNRGTFYLHFHDL